MRFVILLLTITLFGCTSPPSKNITEKKSSKSILNADVQIYFIADWSSNLNFVGHLDKSVSDASGNILYSGDAGAAGLVAQLLAHAVVSSSVQKSRSTAQQNDANKVLQNYWGVIDQMDLNLLYEFTRESKVQKSFNLNKIEHASEATPESLIVKLYPKYFFAEDQRSIMLDMKLEAFQVLSPKQPVYQRSIKSISVSIESDNPQIMWLSGSPSYFETMTKELFAEGLDTLLNDMLYPSSNESMKQKTFKYNFGLRTRYERASLINESCSRTYLRNLKNDLMIIPNDRPCERKNEASL